MTKKEDGGYCIIHVQKMDGNIYKKGPKRDDIDTTQ